MKVQDLIDLLGDCDPDAEVRIMSQEGWPFENGIRGVAVREEFWGDACECDAVVGQPHEEGCPAEDFSYADGLQPTDVFIVEGDQERYGRKEAWEVARR
jgi:hypothetical protein